MPTFRSNFFLAASAATAVFSLSLGALNGDVTPATQPTATPLPTTAPAANPLAAPAANPLAAPAANPLAAPAANPLAAPATGPSLTLIGAPTTGPAGISVNASTTAPTATGAEAAVPATAPSVADIDQLIKQLGSDSSEERDAAQKQLVDIGPPAVQALKKAAENEDDPEIRSRASAALALMRDHQTNDTSLITLHKKDASAQEVLNAIGTQAHAQFIGYGTSGLAPNIAARTVSIDADNKPFWDVMLDFCTQTNVCPVLDTPGKNSMRLFPVARNWMAQSPHQIVGPYWISVAGIYRARSIDLMGPQAIDDQFSVKLIVYPEPKIAATQMSDLKLTEATDDAGNSLLPKPQPNAFVNNMIRATRQSTHTVESRLSYPDTPGKRIATLRGTVTALLAQDVQRYEVDDVLGTPKVTNPLTNVTVKATVTKQGTDMYRVMLECARTGLADDKWLAMMNRMGDLTLEDSDGHPLIPLGMGIATQTSDTTFTGTSLFSRSQLAFARINVAGGAPAAAPVKTGEAKKLVWSVATSLKPITIPILFKDLPMP